MTGRLYYHDSYLREFRARILEVAGNRVYLDRTAFYPTSGGQPFDTGTLAGATVIDVIDEEERIAHIVEAPVGPGEAECAIDWERRFDHMQQHTGQHLLSAILEEAFRIPTVSFSLGATSSTIDVATASLEPAQVADIEERVNHAVCENHSVTVTWHDSREEIGLRKPSQREGVLRVVNIEGLDRSACGGTHVRSTGEIGPVLLRKLEKVRGNLRIEFVCGLRAVRQTRSEYEALARIARSFSAAPGETPALVDAQIARLAEAGKLRQKLGAELAGYRGRQLHADTTPDPQGLRVAVQRPEALDEELRAEAQAFTSAGRGVFVALAAKPPSVLLAASADAGISAGEVLKPLLARHGGRGGGNPQLAQGSAPDAASLDRLAAELHNILGHLP